MREDEAIRAVVLTATGKACTGADLSGSRAVKGERTTPHRARRGTRWRPQKIQALWDLEKPIIVGERRGGQAGATSRGRRPRDRRRAVHRGLSGATRFSTRWGVPAAALGLHKAKELVFFGDDLSAADAERIGLVNKVVPAAELETETKKWAAKLAQGPTFAIGMSKRLLNRSLQSDLDTCFAEEAFSQALTSHSEDMREGIRSFMEKRTPAFKGR